MTSEVSRAKTLADFATAKQSARFLKDDFLRNLPITRIDIGQVSIKLKIGVDGLKVDPNESPFISSLVRGVSEALKQPQKKNEKPIEIPLDQIQQIAAQVTVQTIGPRLSEIDYSKISGTISSDIKNNLSNLFATRFNDQMLKNIPSILKARTNPFEVIKNVFQDKLMEYANKYKGDLAAQLAAELGRLEVIIETEKLKTFPVESLVDMQLTLDPRAFHWALKSDYVNKPEKIDQSVLASISGITEKRSKEIWNLLVKNNFIKADGHVTDTFDKNALIDFLTSPEHKFEQSLATKIAQALSDTQVENRYIMMPG